MAPNLAPTAADARRFCARFVVALGLLAAVVTGFDALMDPYMVFGTPPIAHLNVIKPASEDRPWLVKPYLFRRIMPQTLILGSSKVAVGLDPASPMLPADAGRVFNLGVLGASPAQICTMFEEAAAAAPIRRVLVVLDLIEFMRVPDTVGAKETAGEPPFRFLPDGPRRREELLSALLSRDALRDAILTLATQGRTYPTGLTADGLLLDGNFRRAADAEGPAALFDHKRASSLRAFRKMRDRLAAAPATPIPDIDGLHQMIALSRARHIALDIAIAPAHAETLRIIALAGLWPRYEAAKRSIAATIAAEADASVPLWDFMGFDPFSTEPAGGRSGAEGEWFWEPSHFRRTLGEKLLATIYRGGTEFGRRLTVEGMDSAIGEEAHLLAQDQRDHPDAYAALRAALDPP